MYMKLSCSFTAKGILNPVENRPEIISIFKRAQRPRMYMTKINAGDKPLVQAAHCYDFVKGTKIVYFPKNFGTHGYIRKTLFIRP